MGKLLLETVGLSKRFSRRPERALREASQDLFRELFHRPTDHLRPGEFWALRDINVSLYAGEVLGVIGHNGAGKSTLINLLAGLMLPTKGEVRLYTKKVAIMDHNGGLNLVETGRENILTQLALHGCPEDEIHGEMEEVISFSELGDFINAAVGTYSLGMRLRLAFSIYTRLNPDIFIVDEALSGGDIRFKEKFQNFLRTYIDNGGSIFLCSHDLYIVQTLCKRCILLDQGTLKLTGETESVINAYQKLSHKSQSTPSETTANTPTTETENLTNNLDPDFNDVVSNEFVSINSIKILNANNGDIYPHSDISIIADFHSIKEYESILLSFEIGQPQYPSLTSLGFGWDEDPIPLTNGNNTFKVSISKLPLAPGNYELRTTLRNKLTGSEIIEKGYRSTPLTFMVHATTDPRMNMIMYRKNIVFISPTCTKL